jgi:hypothetical protein
MSPEEHNCIELIVFDDDGPEGYYERKLFERSHEAITFITTKFTPEEIKHLNFTIANHWQRK